MTPSSKLRRRPDVEAGEWPERIPALLQRVYAARGAASIEQAQPRLTQLLPPELLGGLNAATALLAEAIARDRHIVVVGDFDCDGATACAVGVRGLRLLGARRVSHAVPHRIVHGYGLSPALVEELAALQLTYFTSNPIPKFTGKVGMTTDEFQAAVDTWDTAMDEYEKKLSAHSIAQTDCVGDAADFCKTEEKEGEDAHDHDHPH